MYVRHFGLASEPFSIAPDPRFLFMSAAHREALAHLLYGQQGGGGFVLLTGDIGTGKTTVCRAFLEQLPAGTEVAYVLNPRLNATELLHTVCEEFGITIAADGVGLKALVDAINAHLLARHAAGGRSLLLIDEAQNLSRDVLEQLRLLTNLETSERKLLQIILIGQPELRDKLASPRLTQLAQRIIARYHLGPLSREDCDAYVAHRLAVAGHRGELPFERAALRALHRISGGVPRRLNLLADRALLGAYAAGQARVTRAVVRRAAAEVLDLRPPPRQRRWRWALAGFAAIAAAALLGAWASRTWNGTWYGTDMVATGAAGTLASTANAASAQAPGASVAAASATTLGTGAAAAASPAHGGALPDISIDDEASAWAALATLWGEAGAARSPCTSAMLRCFRAAQFTLAQLRQLDRPGFVTLRREDGRSAPAVLLAANDQAVVLRQANALLTLNPTAFGERWLGDFSTLWRARGQPDAKPTTEWLAAQLQGLPGAPASGDAPGAARAAEQVRAFQRAQGLVADGVPGALTLMQLNRALGVAEPRLQR